MGLLAAEITAVTGRDPAQHYESLTETIGRPAYARIDAPASPEQKKLLKSLKPEQVKADKLAGEPILQRLTAAPGNQQPFGGLKIVSQNGWFAARPSGTENVYKIYAESFLGADHLKQIQQEAQAIVADTFKAAGV
jgi:phosphoglucomutase